MQKLAEAAEAEMGSQMKLHNFVYGCNIVPGAEGCPAVFAVHYYSQCLAQPVHSLCTEPAAPSSRAGCTADAASL